MLFNSVAFIVFLPIVIMLYYLIPGRFRWILLLIASYYFYMSWRVEYIFLIVFSTLIDYFVALRMERIVEKRKRRPWLALSLFANLGLLFVFKYFNFVSDSVNTFCGDWMPTIELLLPVGISFYTFQTLSYSIDVYNGKQQAERHLGYFALYVSYFPQLVAGPIERFSRLTPQLKTIHNLKYENIANGFRLILFGLFIKMVIADNLAGIVDAVYEAPNLYSSLDLSIGVVFYAFQIYGDFFGYSVVAIGAALMMGVNLMDNFKTPYLSKSISEFWQRWHISLSTWFRDYLYFPIGGNRVKQFKWILNILVVFIVSGIWHGANWTFVFWGGLYAIIYLIEKGFNPAGKEIEAKPFSIKHIVLALKTFILVTLIWVFFRSQSLNDALTIFKELFTNGWSASEHITVPIATITAFIAFVLIDIRLYNTRFDVWVGNLNGVLRWLIYSILIFAIIVFAGVEDFPFIYFQF